MKSVITFILVAFGFIAVFGPETPAEAQYYCGRCCGTDVYGNLVPQCYIAQSVPCGNACWCPNVPGTGQAC